MDADGRVHLPQDGRRRADGHHRLHRRSRWPPRSRPRCADDERVACLQYDDTLEGMFRTPSLLNVGDTPPYFHSGAVQTLEDVIWHYNQGGGAEGTFAGTKSPQIKPLRLSDAEVHDLAEFLRSLSGKTPAQQAEEARAERVGSDHASGTGRRTPPSRRSRRGRQRRSDGRGWHGRTRRVVRRRRLDRRAAPRGTTGGGGSAPAAARARWRGWQRRGAGGMRRAGADVRALTPRSAYRTFHRTPALSGGRPVKVARVPDDFVYPPGGNTLLRVKRLVGTTLIAAAVAVGLLALRSATGERARAEATVRADGGPGRGGATGESCARSSARRSAAAEIPRAQRRAGRARRQRDDRRSPRQRGLVAAVPGGLHAGAPDRRRCRARHAAEPPPVPASRRTWSRRRGARPSRRRRSTIGTQPYLLGAARLTEAPDGDPVLVLGRAGEADRRRAASVHAPPLEQAPAPAAGRRRRDRAGRIRAAVLAPGQGRRAAGAPAATTEPPVVRDHARDDAEVRRAARAAQRRPTPTMPAAAPARARRPAPTRS